MRNGENDFTGLLLPGLDGPIQAEETVTIRLDTLLPQDAETGAVTPEAFAVYLNTMLAMVSRAQQPLSVIALAADSSPVTAFPGQADFGFIGRAMARCVRQETRPQDVVGIVGGTSANEPPRFVIACPLMSEAQAAALGERMREAMTANASEWESPWLTLSVGVAALTLDTPNSDALLNRAQSALLRAQRGGGQRVWRHSETAQRLEYPLDFGSLSNGPGDETDFLSGV